MVHSRHIQVKELTKDGGIVLILWPDQSGTWVKTNREEYCYPSLFVVNYELWIMSDE